MSQRRKHREASGKPSYTGNYNTATTISVIQYSDNHFSEEALTDLSGFDVPKESSGVTWIRVKGMNDVALIVNIVKKVGLREIDATDVLTAQHIMTVEEHEKSIFMIVPVSYTLDNKIRSEQVAFILGKGYLVTIQESDYPLFESIYTAIKSNKIQKFSSRKSDFLMASLLSVIMSNYGETIVNLEDQLEVLEDQLLDFDCDNSTIIHEIQERRRILIQLRKTLIPFKDQLSKLLRVEEGLISPSEIAYFKDVYDQLLYSLQNIESCREILSSLVDLYLSNNDLKMNQIMKQLTLIATIFIPLTFLVGVWGMNFSFMPELSWKYGYLVSWILFVVVGVFIWIYLKKKKWI